MFHTTYLETSELLQHSNVRNAVSTPVEVDSAGWKSDASVYQRLVQVSDKIQKWKTQLEMESRVKVTYKISLANLKEWLVY